MSQYYLAYKHALFHACVCGDWARVEAILTRLVRFCDQPDTADKRRQHAFRAKLDLLRYEPLMVVCDEVWLVSMAAILSKRMPFERKKEKAQEMYNRCRKVMVRGDEEQFIDFALMLLFFGDIEGFREACQVQWPQLAPKLHYLVRGDWRIGPRSVEKILGGYQSQIDFLNWKRDPTFEEPRDILLLMESAFSLAEKNHILLVRLLEIYRRYGTDLAKLFAQWPEVGEDFVVDHLKFKVRFFGNDSEQDFKRKLVKAYPWFKEFQANIADNAGLDDSVQDLFEISKTEPMDTTIDESLVEKLQHEFENRLEHLSYLPNFRDISAWERLVAAASNLLQAKGTKSDLTVLFSRVHFRPGWESRDSADIVECKLRLLSFCNVAC